MFFYLYILKELKYGLDEWYKTILYIWRTSSLLTPWIDSKIRFKLYIFTIPNLTIPTQERLHATEKTGYFIIKIATRLFALASLSKKNIKEAGSKFEIWKGFLQARRYAESKPRAAERTKQVSDRCVDHRLI